MRAGVMLVAAVMAVSGCDDDAPRPTSAPDTAARPSAVVVPTQSASTAVQLDEPMVATVVAAERDALLRRCASFIGAPIELQLLFEIHADGTVADVAVVGGRAEHKELRGCVEEAAKTWHFPASAAGGTVPASLTLVAP